MSIKLGTCLLGVLNGIIYQVFVHSTKWAYWRYILNKDIEIAQRGHASPPFLLDPPEVLWLQLVSVLFFLLASYLVQHYWKTGRKSIYLLWVTIGVIAVVFINVVHLALAWVDTNVLGNNLIYQRMFSPFYPAVGALSFVISVFNSLIFASIVKVGILVYGPRENA